MTDRGILLSLLESQTRVEAVLREVKAELASLRGAVAARSADVALEMGELLGDSKPRRVLSVADAEILAALIPLVAAHCGARERAFAVRDVLRDLPEHAPATAARLTEAMGTEGKSLPKRLGKLLRRGLGLTFDGLVLAQAGDDRVGAMWVLKPAGNPQTRCRDCAAKHTL